MRKPYVPELLARFVRIAWAIAVICCADDAAHADLIARYTFDDNNANDSSGFDNHGTMLGNAAIVNDPIRGLVLSLTGAGGKVDLGNPASLNVIGEFTAAAWINPASLPQPESSAGILQRGHQSNPSREFTMRIGQNGTAYEFGTWSPNQHAAFTAPVTDLNTWVHIAGTMTEDIPGAFSYRLYRNAELMSTAGPFTNGMWPDFTVGWAIGARGGQSAATFERVFDGFIDDVQIFNETLDQAAIQQIMSGVEPTSAVLSLDVDPIDGEVQLKNDTANSIVLNSYRITSTTGALSVMGWNPISDGNELSGQFPAGNGTGNGWELAQNPSDHELVEWYLNGDSTLEPSQSLYLGTAFDPTGVHNLQLQYTTAELSVRSGDVQYTDVVVPGLPGDYNDDGTVNAADYVVWRDRLGLVSDLPNDLIGGTVDDEQYFQWKTYFGKTASGAATSTSLIPEPATAGLLSIAAVCVALSRRRAT